MGFSLCGFWAISLVAASAACFRSICNLQEIRTLWYEYTQGRYHVDPSLRAHLDTSAVDDESAHASKRFVLLLHLTLICNRLNDLLLKTGSAKANDTNETCREEAMRARAFVSPYESISASECN